MKSLLKKSPKVATFFICLIWIPVILCCTHLLTAERKGSLFSFVLVSILLLIILLAIRWFSRYIERNKNPSTTTLDRIRKQFLYGFFLPIGLFIFLTIIYNVVLSNNVIMQASFIKDLSLVSMFLYVANSFYLVIYLDRSLVENVEVKSDAACYNEKVLVYHRGTYVPINLMEIALVYQHDQINWITTFNEEEHILDLSLKEIQEILSADHFFKINRSHIIHKDSVEKFSSGSYGKINVVLKINKITSTVSKDRAKDFRDWFYK